MTPNLTRVLLVAAVLGSTAMAGCTSTSDQQSAAPAQQSAGTAQSAGEVIDDGVVTAKVKARLVDDPVTKAYPINVETFKGTVQLSGFGVKDVKNSLQVRKAED